jgi:hypothetical protein
MGYLIHEMHRRQARRGLATIARRRDRHVQRKDLVATLERAVAAHRP